MYQQPYRRRRKKKISILEAAAIYTRRHPIVLVIMLGIIIGLIVALIIVASGKSASSDDTEPVTKSASEATDTSEEDAKWTKENGFMVYNDPDYITYNGIDVADFMGEIDWNQVKDAGINFAIARVGYRGYETGLFDFDERLTEYLDGATKAGLRVGVYFVTQAISEEEAIEEADACIEAVENYNLELPIYIDCEANTGTDTRTDDLTKSEYTAYALAFCKRVEEKGYKAGIYSNADWITRNIDIEKFYDYDVWFAKYYDVPSTTVKFNMWQYDAFGVVPGINYDTDMNARIEKK